MPDVSPADHLADLTRYLVASPSPFHAVAESARRLDRIGYRRLDEAEPWTDPIGRRYVVRGGSLVAWSATTTGHEGGLRIIGAHTDSPNLRIRPRPDRSGGGPGQLGVEVYGSPILDSWFDRDLGLSGRVAVRTADGLRLELLTADEPLLRIPRLAIHLDRGVSEGIRPDPQRHLSPMWSAGAAPSFRSWLGQRLDVDETDVVSWDLMTHDLEPPSVLGVDRSLYAAPRLDDLLSCHAAITALEAVSASGHDPVIPVVALFDHEEVGSTSATGAGGALLTSVVERLLGAMGEGTDRHAVLARSACISADGAHATHPNWPERHEPEHPVRIDGGPVLKSNAQVRYATDARGAASVLELAERYGVPMQHFVSRNDMPCGSTIGPVTAARLGISTVDVGVAQLSMHSARELTGTLDPHRFATLLEGFLRHATPLP